MMADLKVDKFAEFLQEAMATYYSTAVSSRNAVHVTIISPLKAALFDKYD